MAQAVQADSPGEGRKEPRPCTARLTPRREVLIWDSRSVRAALSGPCSPVTSKHLSPPPSGIITHGVCSPGDRKLHLPGHHSLTLRLLTSWEDRKRKGRGTTTRVLGFGNRLSTLVLEAHPRRVRIKATSSAGFSSPQKEPSEATVATLMSDRLPSPAAVSPPGENVSSEQEGRVGSHGTVTA